MWLSLSYVETTNKPHGIFRTIPSLTTLFSSVPADSESASTVQGHAHQTWAYICFSRSNVFPREAVSRHEAGWLGALSSPSHSQKHTSEQRRHSPRDSCSSVWSTNPLHQWSSSLGKYLRYLSVKWSKSPPPSSLPGSAPEGWNLFFQLDSTQHDLCHLQARSGWLMGCHPRTMRSRGVWGC